MLKDYQKHQEKILPTSVKPQSSGVACTEKKCKGEMMIQMPLNKHPQKPQLRRAICSKCGWAGWV